MSKAANFGYPGGLGARTFIDYAKASYKVTLSEQEAMRLRDSWFREWPEMRPYFERIAEITSDYGPRSITQHKSGRVRGGVSFTSAANSFFQGLAADAAKEAMWLITKACWLDRESPLFGSRMVAFIHDEFVLESPIDRASAAGDELARLMVLGAQKWIPDVPIIAEPKLMRNLDKGAETLRNEKGELVAA
jgi:DNA polymerase-1